MESHDHTKAQHTKKKTPEAKHSGGNHNWKIEDSYNIMSKPWITLSKLVEYMHF